MPGDARHRHETGTSAARTVDLGVDLGVLAIRRAVCRESCRGPPRRWYARRRARPPAAAIHAGIRSTRDVPLECVALAVSGEACDGKGRACAVLCPLASCVSCCCRMSRRVVGAHTARTLEARSCAAMWMSARCASLVFGRLVGGWRGPPILLQSIVWGEKRPSYVVCVERLKVTCARLREVFRISIPTFESTLTTVQL